MIADPLGYVNNRLPGCPTLSELNEELDKMAEEFQQVASIVSSDYYAHVEAIGKADHVISEVFSDQNLLVLSELISQKEHNPELLRVIKTNAELDTIDSYIAIFYLIAEFNSISCKIGIQTHYNEVLAYLHLARQVTTLNQDWRFTIIYREIQNTRSVCVTPDVLDFKFFSALPLCPEHFGPHISYLQYAYNNISKDIFGRMNSFQVAAALAKFREKFALFASSRPAHSPSPNSIIYEDLVEQYTSYLSVIEPAGKTLVQAYEYLFIFEYAVHALEIMKAKKTVWSLGNDQILGLDDITIDKYSEILEVKFDVDRNDSNIIVHIKNGTVTIGNIGTFFDAIYESSFKAMLMQEYFDTINSNFTLDELIALTSVMIDKIDASLSLVKQCPRLAHDVVTTYVLENGKLYELIKHALIDHPTQFTGAYEMIKPLRMNLTTIAAKLTVEVDRANETIKNRFQEIYESLFADTILNYITDARAVPDDEYITKLYEYIFEYINVSITSFGEPKDTVRMNVCSCLTSSSLQLSLETKEQLDFLATLIVWMKNHTLNEQRFLQLIYQHYITCARNYMRSRSYEPLILTEFDDLIDEPYKL